MTWRKIDDALRLGLRGRSGGSSLPKLLMQKRGKLPGSTRPRLTVDQILSWADAHYRRHAHWPHLKSGRVDGAGGRESTSWRAIHAALVNGHRGLPGGSSLPKLLNERRGRLRGTDKPRLAIRQILAWADDHFKRHGRWPRSSSGAVRRPAGRTSEAWSAVDHALKAGTRGLRGGSSLAKLLKKKRGKSWANSGARLTVDQILAWADAHFKRYNRWPHAQFGPVDRTFGANNETWRRIDDALQRGGRRLPGGSSLARLLTEERGRLWGSNKPRCTLQQVLAWVKKHRKRTGTWPNKQSGPLIGAPGKTWSAIDAALKNYGDERGRRITLANLLSETYGKRNLANLPPLTIKQILAWADEHRKRTGAWPQKKKSGPVYDTPGESWPAIDSYLRRGTRGLPAIGGLAALLDKYRNIRNKANAPPVTIEQILAWADAHHRRTGEWPTAQSGAVRGVPNENWMSINGSLQFGRRGLRTRISLAQCLVKYRGKRDLRNPPRLFAKQILAWADAFYKRRGDWPSRHTGRLEEDRQETWSAINAALANGTRGLRGHSSLVKLLSKHHGTLYRRKGLPLKRSQILDWAAAHHELTGKLPTKKSGPVRDIPGETWAAIDASLRVGSRTLPGRSSLAELLNRHYTPAYQGVGQRLTTEKILKWADDFRRRLGRWPTKKSAFVDPSRGEKWSTIDLALREGHRGLTAGSSVHKLLRENRSNP